MKKLEKVVIMLILLVIAISTIIITKTFAYNTTGINMYHSTYSQDGASTKITVRSRKNGEDYDITANASQLVGKEISALSLGKNNGVFCIQSTTNWYGMQTINSAVWKDRRNDKYAYILATPKKIGWSYTSGEWEIDGFYDSPSQVALWHALGQPIMSGMTSTAKTQGEELYKNAIKYQEYVNNYSKLSVLKSPETYTDSKVIGPFKITFTPGEFKEYVAPKIVAYNGDTALTTRYYVLKDGKTDPTVVDNRTEIKDVKELNGKEFYIYCTSDVTKVEFKETVTHARAQYIQASTGQQNIILMYYGKIYTRENLLTQSVSKGTQTTSFTLYKKGKTLNNSVNDARIRVALGTAIKSLKINDIVISENWINSIRKVAVNRVYRIYLDDEGNPDFDYCNTFDDDFELPGNGTYMWRESDGKIRISTKTKDAGRIKITNMNWDGADSNKELRFREDVAPTGYTKNSDAIYLLYENESWKKIDKGTTNWSYTDGKNYATLYNEIEPITNFKIKKEELGTNTAVPETGFSLYFNRVAKIKLGTQNGKNYATINLGTVMDGRTVEGGTRETVWYYKLKTDGTVGTKGYKLAELEEMEDDGSIYVAQNEGDSNTLHVYGLKTDSNGYITIPQITADTEGLEKNGVIVSIYETKVIEKYNKLPGNLYLYYRFNTDENKWKLLERTDDRTSANAEYWEIGNDNREVTVYNEIKPITNLTVYKKEIDVNTPLEDTIFEVYFNKINKIQFGEMSQEKNLGEIFKNLGETGTEGKYYKFNQTTGMVDKGTQGISKEQAIENIKKNGGIYVSSIPENGENNIKILGLKTNSQGVINISKIVPIQGKERDGVVVTITEVIPSAEYKSISGSLYMLCKINDETNKWNLEQRSGYTSFNEKYWDITNNSVKVTIYNEPETIDLSGEVWLDGQQGEKAAANPNGTKEANEERIQGVKVYLYDGNGNKVEQAGLTNPVTTNAEGKYEFKEVRKKAEEYKVYFEYNGLVYNDVGIVGDSKAAEKDEETTAFNNRFKTIYPGESNDGTALTYTYSDKKSNLNTDAAGTTPENSSIRAYTNVYTETTANIDCGLTKKFYDLKLDNLVEKVEYTINGKQWEDVNANKSTTYSTSMFYSDYYYRFDDYGATIAEFDDEILRKDLLQKAELEAYVTYKVVVGNQNIYTTENVEIDYTYDNSKYELVSIDNEAATGNGKIRLTATNLTSTDNVKEIVLKFKVRKDSERNLPEEIAKDSGLTVETTAEIISYTTAKGAVIDADSEPGNGKEEDDLSKATVNFKLKEEAREISGKVEEDSNKDGKLDGTKINDVIVQLIEIVKDKNGKTYEYIWQETASGSNKVKARSTSNNVYTYTNKLGTGDITGQYQFLGYEVKADGSVGLKTGFIPGDYVIRFIYGDGTTAYLNSDGTTHYLNSNIEKYNGQDYKSTIDNSYKQEWYKQENYKENESTARDNEARRLETMAFSTEIDGGLGVALNTLNKELSQFTDKEKTLLKEYYNKLAADTTSLNELKWAYRASKGNPYDTTINLPTEPTEEVIYNTIKHYISWKTWMSAETSKIEVGINASKFNQVNFGLMLRPTTELTLEKHITGLKITPTGVGVQPVVDAKADINQIINNGSATVTGITNGLATNISTRGNRGFWKVETDIEELIQGAKLEVEYTYVIKNESEDDYLTAELVDAYRNNPKEYANTLKTLSTSVKGDIKSQGAHNVIGKTLGEFYYTGVANTSTDKRVPSIVESLEQSLNNKLKYNENTSGESFEKVNTEAVEKNIYNTEGTDFEKENIETVLQSTSPSTVLIKDGKDFSKKVKLETILSSVNNGEIGANIPTYIAEITKYSNAAGRENVVVAGNLNYVHSKDNTKTMGNSNEADEFWGETIIISKPTGENKNAVILITIISSIAVLGVGIVLVKKYALKK